MRVLLIDVNCKYSSTGKIVYDLYSQLNAQGHTAAIAYGRGPLVEELQIVKFSSNIEVYAHALLTRLTGLTGCFSPFATNKLLRFMESFQPDVVHLHDLHGYFVNILPLMRYLKERNVKTIWTFHCEFMYTGKCGHAYECNQWKSECQKCPHLQDYPSSYFFDYTKKMFQEKKRAFEGLGNLIIVTPSEWLARRVRQSFLQNKEIVVIPNGIDTHNIFFPRKYDHLKKMHNLNDEKVVLAVAPNILSEAKGGRFVLELAKSMINENVKFILIGVDKAIDSVGDNVIMLGRLNDPKALAEYYSMADVFVICSLRETFPTTCLEALCCGTSVCGFDAGGTKETTPQKYGQFVKYGDLDSLKHAVNDCLRYQAQTTGILEFDRSIYAKETMLLNYLKVYQRSILPEVLI